MDENPKPSASERTRRRMDPTATRRLVLVTALWLPALGCGTEPEGASSSDPEPASDAPPAAVEEAFFRLRRTECYGTCPAYTVEADSDGLVTFEGIAFVHSTGTHTARVAPEAIASLAVEAVDLGFLDLSQEEVNDCAVMATDNPSATLTLRIDGRENTIEYDYGCSGREIHETLKSLMRQVDETLGTSRWIEGSASGSGR